MKNLIKTDEGFRDRLKHDYIHAINLRDAYKKTGNSDMAFYWEGYSLGIRKYINDMGFIVKYITNNEIEIVERIK